MICSTPISRIALVQTLFILIGVLMTVAHLKLYSFTDGQLDWNPIAIAVRNYGFLLLIIPTIWALTCTLLERNNTNRWSPFMTAVSGFVLIACFCCLFYWTITTPHFTRFSLQPMGQ